MEPEKTNLSVEEVCRILEVSKTAGVLKLKFQDLHVTFGRPAETESNLVVQQPPGAAPVKDLTEAQHQTQNDDALQIAAMTIREDQLEYMRIADPARYEQMLRNGELDDELDTADSGDDDDGE